MVVLNLMIVLQEFSSNPHIHSVLQIWRYGSSLHNCCFSGHSCHFGT